MTTTEIAKQVRADIRNAIKNQALGDYPEGIKFSVRSEYYSGGSSIDITVKNAPNDWAFTASDLDSNRTVLSAAVKDLGAKLAAIVEEHRNGRRFAAFVYADDAVISARCPR
jgi:hypothetical protein